MEPAGNSMGDERDMISSLPDCLIHLIMSFLTAQQAVRTCVLSKRWKNLWTTLPFLNFDQLNFEYDDESDDSELEFDDTQRYKINKFREFVNTALLLREASNLHKFHISCHPGLGLAEYGMFMRSWILYALKHNPQELHIYFMFDGSVPLSCIFSCSSLVDASLNFPLCVKNINTINLPCLRRLHLMWIVLYQEFFEKLFCGCPVLEFLHLEDCYRKYSIINSQSLKYLKVENHDSFLQEKESIVFKLFRVPECVIKMINTPNLLSFCYTDWVDFFGHKMLLKMPSLTSANIHITCPLYKLKNWSYKGKSNILMGLPDVQNLKLSGSRIKDFLESELPNYPVFSNLKYLSVDGLCLSCHFNLLASFLNHCLNLEKLSLLRVNCHCEEVLYNNRESLNIAPFKGKQLRTVEVEVCGSDKDTPQIMKYLHNITEESSSQIKMTDATDLLGWLFQELDVSSSSSTGEDTASNSDDLRQLVH
ncbi:hypothetical protein LUZ61_016166 [Rhynchospora tenuis]|uniref:F-box domain-containing protein n=1 Tax=Rhynchospora tenuis TaxID=198213 RepID=A0AAD6EJQ7_9POAL|nr:hypothetical protein LUZ61_016166 [Rhynchospora tenuis]